MLKLEQPNARSVAHLFAALAGAISLLPLIACSGPSSMSTDITYRGEVTPVTRVEDALPGVFVPPFLDCRPPLSGETTASPDGLVCTQVSIAGATEPGKAFSSYASCEVVRSQRPYYPIAAKNVPVVDDPRVSDAAFMAELAWAKSEISSTGCSCCHDARISTKGASRWDLDAKPIWLDTVPDSGLALFAGLADSSVLGAYPAKDNHGFDRTATGIPTTDTARMLRFIQAELARRGISGAQARATPPFGGPIYDNSVRAAVACDPGTGIDADGHIAFSGGKARYIYVLATGSKNPGVPPNLDRPSGTLWRLVTLPSAVAFDTGVRYGTTPAGTFQDLPETGIAPALVKGATYQLTVLRDVGLPLANCLFVHGDLTNGGGASVPDAATPATMDGGVATAGFGVSCVDNGGCAGAASYCALTPGTTTGYCTATGCKETPAVCPAGWSCFDVSLFQPGAPSICTKP